MRIMLLADTLPHPACLEMLLSAAHHVLLWHIAYDVVSLSVCDSYTYVLIVRHMAVVSKVMAEGSMTLALQGNMAEGSMIPSYSMRRAQCSLYTTQT